MKKTRTATAGPRLALRAETAADLMTSNPVSISADATAAEAAAFLAVKGFSAAPVIDDAGRPVGVLSQSDIVVHDRERAVAGSAPPDDKAKVRDLMTPVVFSVSPQTPAYQAVEDLLARQVHRLFVVDAAGVLVGVISATDVIRCLRPEER